MPPHSEELEKMVIGIMLNEAHTIDVINGMLSAEMFYKEGHRHIFQAIMNLSQKGSACKVEDVIEALRAQGLLELAGGPYYLVQCDRAVTSTAGLENRCLILMQRYMQREMIRLGAEMHNEAFDSNQDVFDMLDRMEKQVMAIGSKIADGAVGMEVVLAESLREIEKNRARGEFITGVPTGYPGIDRVTRGWQPGDLIIIAARPAVGKTAFALSLARAAAKAAKGVAFFSLEMSRVRLGLRLISAESETFMHLLQTGKLDDFQMKELYKKGINALAKMPIYIDDGVDLNPMRLRSALRRLKRKHGIELAVIDYLQLMKGKGQNREQEVADISRSLKNIARELGISIIALSQLSREVERRKNNEPVLADIRESGAIEQDADVVGMLWAPSDDDIERDPGLSNRRFFKIAKARDGMLDKIDLFFRGAIQQFAEEERASRLIAIEQGQKPVYTELPFPDPKK